jgi:hypothetical protein
VFTVESICQTAGDLVLNVDEIGEICVELFSQGVSSGFGIDQQEI